MVAKKISKYASKKDSNGEEIGKWAIDLGDAKAKCKACGEKSFSFSFGKGAFMQHSSTDRHKQNMKKLDRTKKQTNIGNLIAGDAQEQLIKQKAKRFEVDLTRRLDSHNIPFTFVPCLVDCLKTNLKEIGSDIVKKMELG